MLQNLSFYSVSKVNLFYVMAFVAVSNLIKEKSVELLYYVIIKCSVIVFICSHRGFHEPVCLILELYSKNIVLL